MQMTAHDLIFSLTAAHSTQAQDEALEDVADLLAEQGAAATADGWLPDDRYEAVAAAVDLIPDFDALADKVAADHDKVPAVGGLDNDPLTQAMHDVYSEAQPEEARD